MAVAAALALQSPSERVVLTNAERRSRLEALYHLVASGRAPAQYLERWGRIEQLLELARERRAAA